MKLEAERLSFQKPFTLRRRKSGSGPDRLSFLILVISPGSNERSLRAAE